MPKMIVLDLDNTLLQSDKTISDYTISTLKACQAQGIKVAFATARSTQSTARVMAQFMPNIFIGFGGASALADDDVIHRFDIPADISSALIQACLQTPEISHIYAISESLNFTNNISRQNAQNWTHYQYYNFPRDDGFSYLKITIEAENPDIVGHIASAYPMCSALRYAGEDLYQITNCNATKWNAIKAIAVHHDISTDALVAFGDDKIDLEMIQNCGIGVAVANAIDEVKAVADHICDTNDNNGVAKWLEQHIL